MHTEYTPGITAVAASLLSEASAVTTVLDGELSGLDPLIGVEGGEGLLAGRDQVSIRLGGCRTLRNAVQLLIKLGELRSLGHLVAVEHERGLVRSVACDTLATNLRLEIVRHKPLLKRKVVA